MTVAPADSTSRASTPPSTRPHHPHPRSYGMDTSHSRPFFDSKWNRQGVGRIRFGIEIHRFSQLSNQELAPIEMCPPIGAGVGVKLCSAAPTPSRSRPASAANQQAPTLTRPHKRGDGRRRPFPSSRAPFYNRDGPGWGEPLPSRARNPLSIAPCFCRKSAGQPGRHRSLNYCTTGPPNPRTTHNPRPPCGQGGEGKKGETASSSSEMCPPDRGWDGVIHARRNAIVAVRWREQEFTEHRHSDQKRSLSFWRIRASTHLDPPTSPPPCPGPPASRRRGNMRSGHDVVDSRRAAAPTCPRFNLNLLVAWVRAALE